VAPRSAGVVAVKGKEQFSSSLHPRDRGSCKEVSMNSTYIAPSLATRGSVTALTLGEKAPFTNEVGTSKKLGSGADLSFGL
jgi:hypothetical protein